MGAKLSGTGNTSKKKELHPALRANADKLKAGEALSPGRKKRPAKAANKMTGKATKTDKAKVKSASKHSRERSK